MKKFALLAASCFAAAMIFTSQAAFADNEITINVNGTAIETQTPPVIVNERTLVPLRAVSNALGCDIAWDGDTKGITVTDGTNLVFTWIGRDNAFVTSAVAIVDHIMLDSPPVIMNNYTMVPIRAISEIFGAQVDWNDATRSVDIKYTYDAPVTAGLAAKFATYEQVLDKKYNAYSGLIDGTGNFVEAEIQLENGGVIELELYPDIAPATVENFVSLANNHFYDGLIFHRVIKDFMIQGGGFDTDYNRKDAANITGEFLSNGYLNLIPHSSGVISMARATDYDSASSQFFIVHKATPSLNGQYAAFGRVISGMDFVNQIAETPTEYNDGVGDNDVPVTQQVIKTIVIK